LGASRSCISLVQTTRDEHINALDMVDSMDYFENVIIKWKNTIIIMMGFNQSTHMGNRPTYKEKWIIIYGHIHG
jgi:hypothetical protein